MQIKNLVFGIGIIILTILAAVYGISVFYPAANYDDYCGDVARPSVSDEWMACTNACDLIEDDVEWDSCVNRCDAEDDARDGLINNEFKVCSEEYETAREMRAKKVFFIAVPLGIILIFIGAFFFGLEAVGAGLMGGGIGTIIYGAGSYWQYSGDVVKFVISLFGLVAVIYLSYWLNNRKKKKFLFWKK